MAKCDECGKHENLPYQCRRCGGTFCADHRLPESHECPGLNEWNDPSGVFDSGFNESVRHEGGRSQSRTEQVKSRLLGTGGIMGYFRGNMAYVLLTLMWIVFALEFIVLYTLGADAFFFLFVLQSDHLLRAWTWVTAVFSHAPRFPPWHIVGNSIVLYFFGPLTERYVGSKKFTILFIGSGIAAGAGHIGAHLLFAELGMFGVIGTTAVLGASGAIFAILGVLTVLNPDLRIYLYFFIPIPLWLFTFGFAILSIVFFISPTAAATAGQSNVAHFAHLIGLVIGLAYGRHIQGRYRVPDQLQFGGGGGGGPGGPGGPGQRRGPF